MVLILDEAALVPDGGKSGSRAMVFRELGFRLASGRVRDRYDDPTGPISRFIFLMSTNRAAATLRGATHAGEFEALADRLMTLSLEFGRPHGVFDFCPDGYASTGAFSDGLKRAAAEHFGHALPAFLQWLVNQQHRSPDRLRRIIARKLAHFVEVCGANANDGSEKRVAEAFGLVYVAGLAARSAGVLPSSYRPLAAARMAYDLHRQHGRAARTIQDRLRALMRRPDLIDLAVTPPQSLSYEMVAACPAFLYTGKSKCRELLIPVQWRQQLFPDWNDIRHDPELEQRLKRQSEDRNTVDRPVGSGGKREPVYCFDLTDLSL